MFRSMVRLCGSLLLLLLAMPAAVPAAAQAALIGPVYRLAGTNPDRVYGSTACGVYERIEQRPWSKIPGIDGGPVSDLLSLPDDVLLAVFDGDVYRRAPGAVWQFVLDGNAYGSLAANASGSRVYFLTGVSVTLVFRSDDGGISWQQVTPPAGTGSESYAGDIAVVADPTTQQEVVLVSSGLPGRSGSGSRLHRSTDGGMSWQQVDSYNGTSLTTPQFTVARDGATLYLATSQRPGFTARLFRGTTGNPTVEEIDLPAELRPNGVLRVAAFDNTLILSGASGTFRSGQRGARNTFERFDQGLDQRFVNDLLVTSKYPIGTLLYVATTAGVFARPDGDGQWLAASDGLPACGAETPFTPRQPVPDTPTRRYFPETGHTLNQGFKAFWERNGGLPVFGFPLSEEFDEPNADLGRSFTTQYFERERFEYHPENQPPYTILLGRLGAELLQAQNRDWRAEDGSDNPLGGACASFNVGGETRHVCGPFLDYWMNHGLEFDGRRGTSSVESLALFGLPLTAPKLETNPDGQTVVTQWFERARFEYHPNNTPEYRVLLGRLGSELLKRRGVPVP